ncbi:hypothetical protein ACWDRR_37150 [Kitasatospora sp. NPDC003701]
MSDADRRAVNQLLVIGALIETAPNSYRIHDGLVVNGRLKPAALQSLMRTVPSVAAGLAVLEKDPAARAEDIGQAVQAAASADWAIGTATGVGKHLRAWAREAGITVHSPRTTRPQGQDGLF